MNCIFFQAGFIAISRDILPVTEFTMISKSKLSGYLNEISEGSSVCT